MKEAAMVENAEAGITKGYVFTIDTVQKSLKFFFITSIVII